MPYGNLQSKDITYNEQVTGPKRKGDVILALLFYTNKSEDMEETYGLKSLNCHPKIREMVSFEKDLWNLVDKLKFRKIKSNFLR